MTPSSGADRILSALAGHPAGRALTWVELNAALPSMSAGDMTVRLEELERSGLIQKDLQAGIRGRPWGWSLTDAGRARVGAPTAKASPKPAGTVADLVQEIKAEQDAGFHEKVMAARDAAASRLSLTLHDDGMLEIEVPSTGFSMLLTPSQTSQLGRFLKGTAGVWECPF